MCGPRKKERGCYNATGSLFSVNPETVPVVAPVESDDDIMPGGMTRGRLREILANATKMTEEDRMPPHQDRGYSP